ncbi:Large repetitive protein [Cystobacter fuscus DSM 2262]|uniref:Large repetitive protein n=1 Tax=Cystobacter fuscus (strain ATCC 25194 / DSM 2262 / NBRC 100088 / M29) TaxID=1242864 RepID=S9QK98_CYSF2|nr:Ig-like domain-containing protein [Cystobacter fuscus]EPX56913.1 Large repetitive protein [Cystobacter fuscus DSM 2262]
MNTPIIKKWLAAVLCLLCAQPALAARDIYLLGNGDDGPLDVTAGQRVVNSYAKVTANVAVGATEIPVDTNTGFSPGDLVLVHQSTGLTPEPAPGNIADINLSGGSVGRWELARLGTANLETGKLRLDAPLIYAYSAAGAQVVKVPEYTDVTVRGGAELTADAWNGSKGGILAFLANGAVNIESAASINVTALGFRGGQYIKDTNAARRSCASDTEPAPGGAQRAEGIAPGLYGPNSTGRGNGANGGGGGVCYLAGGAGGGSSGRGGDGGKTHSGVDGARAVGGKGGARFIFDPLNRMVFGGGGGAGHGIIDSTAQGGRGGGIIFIRARILEGGDGTILANGASGPTTTGNSGAFGGGAGGTVYLRFAQLANCNVLSQGGRGGDTSLSTAFIGPGGGGGGGRLLMQSQTGTCEIFAEGAVAGQTPTQRPNDTVNYGATGGSPGDVAQIINDGFPETMPAPVVSTPANGSSTNNKRPTFTGTLDPSFPTGAQIILTVTTGTTTLTFTLPAAANWSYTPTSDLAAGNYTVSAVLTKQEVYSLQSNTNTFTIDLTAPAAPVVATPANGSQTNDTTPIYSGTAEPGSTVTVIVDGSPLPQTVTADANGNWSLTPTSPLDQGTHTVRATARDAAGNVSTNSNTNTFAVDTTPPAAPVATPIYSGTAEPGSTVTVIVDGSPLPQTVTADANGNWSLTPTTPLDQGPHTVTATATDTAGNVSTSSNTNTFTVDTTPPAVEVKTPAEGTTIKDNTPLYSGTAEPGSTVTVIVDGSPVGTITVDGSGTWSITPTTGLSNGPHTVTATATDTAGNSATDSNTFTVDVVIPASPVVTGPPNGTVINDNTPVITGTAPPNSTVTVIVDGNPIGTTTSDPEGNWTYTPTTPLPDGPHDITAITTNEEGNASPPSNTVRVTIDTEVPDTTIISGPEGTTPNRSATFEFDSGEPGVTYECRLDGGEWTACTSPVTYDNLPDGEHTFEVRSRDSAGNVDATPATRTWTVHVGDIDFRGDGFGCSASGGDSSLVLMALGSVLALARRRRQR